MAGTTPSSNAGNAGPGISEQILDSVRTSLARGEREVEIRLHPPELGSILARFKEQDGQLHGMLEVNRSDTRQEIERAMPQVLQSLQDLGVQVKRLDVTIADQSRRDAGGEQLSQEAWSQQHNSGQNRDPLQATPMRWLHDGADFSVESNETPDTGQQTGVGQRGINVLL